MRAKEDRKSQGPKGDQEMSEKDDISFCPLALPLIAGPGAIAVVINSGNHASTSGPYLLDRCHIWNNRCHAHQLDLSA